MMQLVRQIQLKPTPLLDDLCIRSKNLFNVATFTVRQHLLEEKTWIRYYDLWKLLKSHKAYKKLAELAGSHPPQQVLKQVERNFKGFFEAMKVWKKSPEKFYGRPKLPKYKPKNGKNVVYFTKLQVRNKENGVLLTRKMQTFGFPLLKTDLQNVKGVRIVPFGDRYNIELIYDYTPEPLDLNKKNVLAIDLGLTNIVTTSDNCGSTPLIIKGGVLKSINQYYNKKLARFKSFAKKCNNTHSTKRILKFHRKRNNKIRDFFHKTSRKIINHCIVNNIGTIVVGYNKGWKQKSNIGRKNNQNFVSVPFLKLVQQLEYKGKMVGIDVKRITEEYTSQMCSHCGIVKKSNRKHRGLYVCSECGLVLNADVNASKNILQKGVPESVWIGDRGLLDRPAVSNIS